MLFVLLPLCETEKLFLGGNQSLFSDNEFRLLRTPQSEPCAESLTAQLCLMLAKEGFPQIVSNTNHRSTKIDGLKSNQMVLYNYRFSDPLVNRWVQKQPRCVLP